MIPCRAECEGFRSNDEGTDFVGLSVKEHLICIIGLKGHVTMLSTFQFLCTMKPRASLESYFYGVSTYVLSNARYAQESQEKVDQFAFGHLVPYDTYDASNSRR